MIRRLVAALSGRHFRDRREWRQQTALQEWRLASDIALHLGCGGHYIPGMVNADAFDGSVRDVALDALHLTAYANNSVALIENHHMLEHLNAEEGLLALAEWHRVLRPGGRLVITCPDLDRVARMWIRSSHQVRFRRPQSPVVAMIYGSQEHPGMYHKWGYNRHSLRETLEEIGFDVETQITPFPAYRPTPSMLTVAVKNAE